MHTPPKEHTSINTHDRSPPKYRIPTHTPAALVAVAEPRDQNRAQILSQHYSRFAEPPLSHSLRPCSPAPPPPFGHSLPHPAGAAQQHLVCHRKGRTSRIQVIAGQLHGARLVINTSWSVLQSHCKCLFLEMFMGHLLSWLQASMAIWSTEKKKKGKKQDRFRNVRRIVETDRKKVGNKQRV